MAQCKTLLRGEEATAAMEALDRVRAVNAITAAMVTGYWLIDADVLTETARLTEAAASWARRAA